MPELPEVETVRRGLVPALEGHIIEDVRQQRQDLRFPLPDDFAVRLAGRRVTALERRAKYIQAFLDNGEVLIIHLGMSGRMSIWQPGDNLPRPPIGRHDHIVLTTDAGAQISYHDPRRFGYMDLCAVERLAEHPFFAGLGPEPLSEEFSPEYLSALLFGKKTPIKSALLDQRVVAGLGNIYVCEALFEAGISPRRLARTIPGKRAARLVPAIKDVLLRAIAAGGSSLRDYQQVDGELGYFQHSWRVYGREGQSCGRPGCACTIRRIVQSGRSTFYCPKTQR